MSRNVFLSYRRNDCRYQARMMYGALCRHLPRERVFIDVDSIPPGVNYRRVLRQRVSECDVLIALIGSGWLNAADPRTGGRRLDNADDCVRIEIGEALARGIPVVPVLVDGTEMPESELLPDDIKELAERQAEVVEFRTFDADVALLIRKLIAGLTGEHELAQSFDLPLPEMERTFEPWSIEGGGLPIDATSHGHCDHELEPKIQTVPAGTIETGARADKPERGI